jgi:hypothetical protein
LDALKAERRALKKLYAFAVKHANSVVVPKKGKAAERSAKRIRPSKVRYSGAKPAKSKPAKSKPTKSKTAESGPKARAGAPDGDLKT